MAFRRRFQQTLSLKDRLAAFAEKAREQAETATGPEREELIKKAHRADTASHIDEWASSPGLQPTK